MLREIKNLKDEKGCKIKYVKHTLFKQDYFLFLG